GALHEIVHLVLLGCSRDLSPVLGGSELESGHRESLLKSGLLFAATLGLLCHLEHPGDHARVVELSGGLCEQDQTGSTLNGGVERDALEGLLEGFLGGGGRRNLRELAGDQDLVRVVRLAFEDRHERREAFAAAREADDAGGDREG